MPIGSSHESSETESDYTVNSYVVHHPLLPAVV